MWGSETGRCVLAPEAAEILTGETPLERAARCALAARDAIDEDGSASLRLLIDMVLLEAGREIARRSTRNDPEERSKERPARAVVPMPRRNARRGRMRTIGHTCADT